MPKLAISLLGTFEVTLEKWPLTPLETDKAWALLAYLAVEADRSHRREALASFFWPDRSEKLARNNLRQTLYRLRQTLSPHEHSVPHLLVSVREIRFNPDGDYWLDVDQFRIAVDACQAHHHRGELPCEGCVRHLEEAAALYKGDFLRGFSLPDSPPFEWWQLTRQETYHSQALSMLEWLGAYYRAIQNYQRAAECALSEIELEPWRESAHRRAMRALAMSGQRRAALRHFDMCRRMLSQELGTGPSNPTVRIFEQIRHGTLQDD